MKLSATSIARMTDTDLERVVRWATATIKRFAGSRRMGHSQPEAARADRALALARREQGRRAGKKRLADLQTKVAMVQPDADVYASAAALGVLDHLPAPQDEQNLPSAA